MLHYSANTFGTYLGNDGKVRKLYMSQSINKTLTTAILRLLRPLVRLLLRHGISYGAFADLAKAVYVDVADKEFSVEGKKQTASRISIVTGLSRKEVARVQAIETREDEAVMQQYNRAARVISGWVRDQQFHKQENEPADLMLEGDDKSFASLVKIYSGDMPSRAILDELLRVKAVELIDNKVRLLTHAYIPAEGESEKLHILGTDVALLINTIDHNISNKTEPAYFQRKVAYDNLPEEGLAQLRNMSQEKAQALLEHIDKYLATQDRDSNPESKGTGCKRAGLGIYYFEEDMSNKKAEEKENV